MAIKNPTKTFSSGKKFKIFLPIFIFLQGVESQDPYSIQILKTGSRESNEKSPDFTSLFFNNISSSSLTYGPTLILLQKGGGLALCT